MNTSGWTWADLRGENLNLLQEAENTLGEGVDVLLAYQTSGLPEFESLSFALGNLKVAPINESQIECLQGLEDKLQAVVIAYQKA
ncbi:MAG: hypothetical protein GX495_13200 [Chloroflexi bacterium]|jgi:hypothetical protein|nr:hypothetical protein [Chloroflexota bacterium]